MNILLTAINAKYIHTNLALYNLRACAKEYQSQIALLQYTINEHAPEILRGICKRKPDFLAVSCYIWNIGLVREVLEDFHKIFPDTPIWLGGPEVSSESRRFLIDNAYVTGIMIGEGEVTFYELLRAYFPEKRPSKHQLQSQLEQVEGLIFRKEDGTIVKTAPRAQMDLNQIPFAYSGEDKHKIMYYESSRGCPFSCSYCLSSLDKKVRFKDLALVKKDLSFFLEQRVSQVKFIDRTFNCNRKRAREIWQFLAENDNGCTNFHFEAVADLLEEEDFAILGQMRPGLIQLEIGVQSVNPRTLEAIRRDSDLPRLREAVRRINEGRNIHQHLDLIAGLPFEDFQSFRISFKEVFFMKPDQLQLGFLKVLKGSYLYEKASEYGIVYMERPPYEVLYTKWISFEEIHLLKGVESMVELYYNSGQFSHTLEAVIHRYENPFDFFMEFAAYFEARHLMEKNHARMAKYDIFREFLKEKFPAQINVYEELLTIDFYGRENAKIRPVWAADLSEYKDDFYEFYQKEGQTRQYLPAYANYQPKQLSKMTHLEVLTHQEEKPLALLFDYQSRSPKNKEARILKIQLPERKDMTDSYVAIDLETTGLNPEEDNILEIGAVLVEQGEAVKEYQTLVLCDKPLPSKIVELTGITEEMAASGIAEEQAMKEIAWFCRECILLGHNVKFDYSFLKAKAVKYGLPLPNLAIDTLSIARKKLADLESRSLEALCVHYQILPKESHRALEDAHSARKLYEIFRREFAMEEELFRPIQLKYKVKKESPITQAQKGYLTDLLAHYGLAMTKDINELTKSEASKKIDEIIREHGKITRYRR